MFCRIESVYCIATKCILYAFYMHAIYITATPAYNSLSILTNL